MDTVYSSLCSWGLFYLYHQFIPRCFCVEGVPDGEGWHQLSLRLFAALGVSCPCPQHLCELSRVPCVTLLSGVCGCPGLQVRALSSVLCLGYSSLHVPVSCATCEVPALPQQKSQVCVVGFGQQIAANFRCGLDLDSAVHPT